METKKTYTAPVAEKVQIDAQIVLVMMSPIGDPPPVFNPSKGGSNYDIPVVK